MKTSILALIPLLFMINNANAQSGICYESVIDVPAGTLICAGDQTNSADFTDGCVYSTVDTFKDVPTPCGDVVMWVPAPANWPKETIGQYNSGLICEIYGYESAEINGAVCASAAMQPTEGFGAGLIDHHMFAPPGSYSISTSGGTNWGLRKIGPYYARGMCSNSPVQYTSGGYARENEVTARACLIPAN